LVTIAARDRIEPAVALAAGELDRDAPESSLSAAIGVDQVDALGLTIAVAKAS
jgi:hypothetical protein